MLEKRPLDDEEKFDEGDVKTMGQEEEEEEEEGAGGKDDTNDFDGKELALELHRIISSDFSLNELAFVPPWKHLRELLGEKFADDEEDENDRKRLKLFYRSFCVREHKLAINAHVIVLITRRTSLPARALAGSAYAVA